MSQSKPLSPFFKYFGSKCRSAKNYPPPKHDVIVEAFAGGAGYALNHHERKVMLFDSDPRVIAVWDYLISATPDEIMALPLMVPGQRINELDVTPEARLFISCCVNTSPFRNVLTQWKNGQNDGLWGEVWRAKVASQVNAIKHWEAMCCSYEETPNVKATHFVDPPYQELDEHYRQSKNNPIDYQHLGQWCKSRHGQVIVCEKTGANWLPFRHLGEFAAVRSASGRTCREAIWEHENTEALPLPSRVKKQATLF